MTTTECFAEEVFLKPDPASYSQYPKAEKRASQEAPRHGPLLRASVLGGTRGFGSLGCCGLSPGTAVWMD